MAKTTSNKTAENVEATKVASTTPAPEEKTETTKEPTVETKTTKTETMAQLKLNDNLKDFVIGIPGGSGKAQELTEDALKIMAVEADKANNKHVKGLYTDFPSGIAEKTTEESVTAATK